MSSREEPELQGKKAGNLFQEEEKSGEGALLLKVGETSEEEGKGSGKRSNTPARMTTSKEESALEGVTTTSRGKKKEIEKRIRGEEPEKRKASQRGSGKGLRASGENAVLGRARGGSA